MKLEYNLKKSVFAIPCNHPSAKDNAFHCVTSFHDAPRMWGQFGVVLLDTRKVLTELRGNSPDLLEYARQNFSGTTPESWLSGISKQKPRDMGFWLYLDGTRGLFMYSGEAAVIELIEKIDLPYFPAAVERVRANFIDEKFGHKGLDSSRPLFTKLTGPKISPQF
jgi:hypothetical protein